MLGTFLTNRIPITTFMSNNWIVSDGSSKINYGFHINKDKQEERSHQSERLGSIFVRSSGSTAILLLTMRVLVTVLIVTQFHD